MKILGGLFVFESEKIVFNLLINVMLNMRVYVNVFFFLKGVKYFFFFVLLMFFLVVVYVFLLFYLFFLFVFVF